MLGSGITTKESWGIELSTSVDSNWEKTEEPGWKSNAIKESWCFEPSIYIEGIQEKMCLALQ